ncbi:MAG TPA: hypothetical protein VNO21_25320 [Polyangiaceae bacterium]|nr:hypothetical protein [Polyangiaceae bacterium]
MKDDKVGAIQRAVAVIGAVGAISGAAACGGETNSHNAVAPPAEQETCENPAENGTAAAAPSDPKAPNAPADPAQKDKVLRVTGTCTRSTVPARSTSIHIGGGGG